MKAFIEKLSGREIAMITTSVGGVVLAGFLAYALWNISSSQLTSFVDSQLKVAQAIREIAISLNSVNGSQQEVRKAIEDNTRIINLVLSRKTQ